MTELMMLQMKYDLPPSLAKILLMLAQNQVVTARMIEIEHRLTKDAKVAMHRLRRRLEGSPVEIKSRRDVGYWLEADARAVIRESMKPTDINGNFETPSGDGAHGSAAAA